ncbi:MAG: DDE-type integrase/transposase/recombinase [Acidimicrobiales bacterium]
MLEIAPSTYWAAQARPPSARAVRDAELAPQLRALWGRNYSFYLRREPTNAARRAGIDVGRDQVARLMRAEGIRGATRAKNRRPAPVRAPDLVKRDFTATRPDATCVADFTYCSTWSRIGYVAFAVDVFSRRIVGWKAARTMHASLVVDALNMAVWTRRGTSIIGVVCHSDAGSPAHLDRLHRPPRRDRRRTLDRHHRRQLRQRPGGDHDRVVQGRVAPQPRCPHRQRRPLARPRRPRDRHLRLGVMVQP